MEHAIDKFEAIDPKMLDYFRNSIKEIKEVQLVYLSEEIRKGRILTVLVKEGFQASAAETANSIGKILQDLPQMRHRIYPLSYAQDELEKGNLYFINYCRFGKLIYRSSSDETLNFKNKEEIQTLLKTASSSFRWEVERINSFTQGINFYRKRKELPGAAYLIHQKIEWLYRCLETFAMGKPLICHKIKAHLEYAHPFIHGAGELFDTKNRTDAQLLEVLDRAYTESRYHSGFDITKREIKVLLERAEIMEQQVKEVFEFRSEECLSFLKKEEENSQDERPEMNVQPLQDKDQNDMNFLKEIILQELQVEKIISFGRRTGFIERETITGKSEIQSYNHYDLLIVAEETAGIYPKKISQLISEKSDGNLATTIVLTSAKKVEQALKGGNEFVTSVFNRGTMIYSENNFSFALPVTSAITKDQIDTKLKDFSIRQRRAKGYLRATTEVEGDEDAIEVSLQYLAIQQICLGAIYVMLGLRPDCLKLEYLLDLCSNFSNAPSDCFPRKSAEDQRLFKKLINALHEVRFRTSNRRGLVDVDILLTRCQTFLKVMENIVEKKLEKLEVRLKEQDHGN